MSKSSIIHLRNLIVFFLVTILSLSVAEAVLSDQKEESVSLTQVHKTKSYLFQWEMTPLEKLLTTEINEIVYLDEKPAADLSAVKKLDTYPLIDCLSVNRIDQALDIVVISDSFGFGIYSNNRNELFWRVLENNLRKDGIRANVYGVATTGANAYEELEWLCSTSLVKDLNPDLVIFGYVYDDPEHTQEVDFTPVDTETKIFTDFFTRRFPKISDLLSIKITAKSLYTNKFSDEDFVTFLNFPVLQGGFYEKYKTNFCEKLNEYASSVDFPICVMTLPNIPHSDEIKAFSKPLHELYDFYDNIRFYDSVNSFNRFASKKHSENYYVNPHDGHPGSATNKFYADYIMDFIRKDFPYLLKNNKGFEAKKEIIINEWLPYDISLKKTSENSYTFRYPSADEKHTIHGIELDDSYFLSYPLGKEHIRLNFADSINISGINAQGEYKNLQLYYTCINKELGYDDHSIYKFSTDGGDSFSVSPDIEITSVLVSAEFDAEANRNITLSFVENGGEK